MNARLRVREWQTDNQNTRAGRNDVVQSPDILTLHKENNLDDTQNNCYLFFELDWNTVSGQ